MSRPNITFIKGNGSNRRTGAGKDYVSGFIFYSASVPSGWAVNNIQTLYSVIDAENKGINTNYADETKATGTYLVTAAGANGDTLNIKVSEPLGVVVDLGTYTKTSSETTVTAVGAAIAAVINAGTLVHGYTASANTGTVTITARKSLGIALNSGTPIVVTLSNGATLAGTLTQFSGGVASKLAVYHYHISEYFRANISGELVVGFFSVPGSYTFSEITTLQNAAVGELRQVAIYKDGAAYASADLTAINTEVVNNCDAKHKPLSVLYAADLKGTNDITTIADLSVLSANKVSSIISQDGAGQGAFLFASYGKSITNVGFALGLLSLSAVSEDFGQPVSKYNLSNGTENDVPAFANGQLVSALTDTALDALNDKRHIFTQKYIGVTGTYFVDNHTAIAATSDYAYINDNRVIDKATRGVYSALIPYLKSKLLKNSDGTLADTTISFLEGQAIEPLYQMERDGDLSTVSQDDVYIDPSQNVSTTSTVIISVKLNESGIARNIQVPISFK